MERGLKERKILRQLLKGKHLTVGRVTDRYNYTELRSFVCKLERMGYIMGRYQKHGNNFKHYYMIATPDGVLINTKKIAV